MTDAAAFPAREDYTIGYSDIAHRGMAQRTADTSADFLLPLLRPGLRVLDVGAGPGTITLGLAEAVAPGEVIGIDFEPLQVERAQALAAERGVANVRFEQGDAYALPFVEDSFDVVFASSVLLHLREPVRAMREFRRVVRPQGLVAITDPDWTLRMCDPLNPLLDRYVALYVKVIELNGGSPGYARGQGRLLREAGFAATQTSTRTIQWGQTGSAKAGQWDPAGAFGAAGLAAGPTRLRGWDTAIARGLTDAAEVEAIRLALLAWSAQPGALHVVIGYRSIGWATAPT